MAFARFAKFTIAVPLEEDVRDRQSNEHAGCRRDGLTASGSFEKKSGGRPAIALPKQLFGGSKTETPSGDI